MVRFREYFTGFQRPRHRRFREQLTKLFVPGMLDVQDASKRFSTSWFVTNTLGAVSGVRAIPLLRTTPALVHQALAVGKTPYLSEFDVPMALYNYSLERQARAHSWARAQLEAPTLRGVLVFSQWAKRSFGLHFGPEVQEKCRVLYPLASDAAVQHRKQERPYTFAFVSSQFRIKAGPEFVRAFASARTKQRSDARMVVVTNLAEARNLLGPLDQFAGVEWREATLGETAIAELLGSTQCLFHPSLVDSFGVVVLEGLAAGCALVATDFASFPELVSHEKNGVLLRPPVSAFVLDDVIHPYADMNYFARYLNSLELRGFQNQIDNCMCQLLADPEKLRSMMDSSAQRYEQEFSPLVWQARMRSVLQECFPELGECLLNAPEVQKVKS